MNKPDMQIACRNCRETSRLQLAGNYQDGSERLVCSCCERDGGVLHRCPNDYTMITPKWLPFLLAGIAIVCPACKKSYDFGVNIEPTYPEAGQALKTIGLVAGVVVLIGVIGDILNGKRRRRRR